MSPKMNSNTRKYLKSVWEFTVLCDGHDSQRYYEDFVIVYKRKFCLDWN